MKLCKDCKHKEVEVSKEPCNQCHSYFTHNRKHLKWEAKTVTMSYLDQGCPNCLHEGVGMDDEPCIGCRYRRKVGLGPTNWQPKAKQQSIPVPLNTMVQPINQPKGDCLTCEYGPLLCNVSPCDKCLPVAMLQGKYPNYRPKKETKDKPKDVLLSLYSEEYINSIINTSVFTNLIPKKETKEMNKNYTFQATDETVDIPRIVKENKEDGNLAFIVEGTKNLIIAVDEKVAKAFPNEKVMVGLSFNDGKASLAGFSDACNGFGGDISRGTEGHGFRFYTTNPLPMVISRAKEDLTRIVKRYRDRKVFTVYTF